MSEESLELQSHFVGREEVISVAPSMAYATCRVTASPFARMNSPFPGIRLRREADADPEDRHDICDVHTAVPSCVGSRLLTRWQIANATNVSQNQNGVDHIHSTVAVYVAAFPFTGKRRR